MFKMIILFCVLTNMYADESYEQALMYLDGIKGGKLIDKEKPRCPYDKCPEEKTFKFLQKDKKTGYEILKNVSVNDERAAFKAVDVLLKQIDYKSEVYDDYLLHKLSEDFGLNQEQYDSDVRYFLNILSNSKIDKNNCRGNFILYSAYNKGYFGLQIDNDKKIEAKRKALLNCANDSYFYMVLNKTKD